MSGILSDPVSGPCRECRDRERWVRRALRRQDTPIADEEVRDIPTPAPLVDYRLFGRGSHPATPDEVREPLDPSRLVCTRRTEHLLCARDPGAEPPSSVPLPPPHRAAAVPVCSCRSLGTEPRTGEPSRSLLILSRDPAARPQRRVTRPLTTRAKATTSPTSRRISEPDDLAITPSQDHFESARAHANAGPPTMTRRISPYGV